MPNLPLQSNGNDLFGGPDRSGAGIVGGGRASEQQLTAPTGATEPAATDTTFAAAAAIALRQEAGALRVGSSGIATRTRRRRGRVLRLVAIDSTAVLISLAIGIGLLVVLDHGALRDLRLAVLLVYVPIILLAFQVQGLYRGNGLRTVPSGLPVTAAAGRAVPLAMLTMVVVLELTGWATGASALLIAGSTVVPALVTVPASRSLAGWVVARRQRVQQRVIIVGSGEVADGIGARLDRYGGITVLGMVDDDPLPGFATVGKVADLPGLCRDLAVDRIIVALPRAPWHVVSGVLYSLIPSVDIAVVPSLQELMTWRSGMADISGLPLINLMPAQRGLPARAAKRIFDLFGASLLLCVALPLWLLSVLAIRLTSGGPAIFRQARTGSGGREFTILKFRTMHRDAEEWREELLDQSDADGPRFKLASDPRVTRVGRFLRRFSIDELPQLLNVLAGNMSLVGPRPFPVVESEALLVGPAAARFDVLPGMTGLWQVSGRSDLTWDDLQRLDAIYVASWSFWWDLRILLQTPAVTLRRQGAY